MLYNTCESAVDLLQVVNVTGLLQLVNKLSCSELAATCASLACVHDAVIRMQFVLWRM